MAATTLPAGAGQRWSAALARLWTRARLPLLATPVGAAVAIAGAYLYWTKDLIFAKSTGEPLAGDLANYGFGGVRLFVLVLGVITLLYGAATLRRPQLRTGTHGPVLSRLALGLTAIPLVWVLTLFYFEATPFSALGPGPWVALGGGVVAWLGARGMASLPAPAATEWGRRSRLTDRAILIGAEVAVFAVCLYGVVLNDPSAFLGYFVALTGLATALSKAGAFKGIAGPMRREPALALVALVVLLLVFPMTQSHNTYWIRIAAQAGLFVMAALGLNIVVGSAGLLDLGYVAFFAIGAYVAALTGNAGLTNHNFHVPYMVVLLVVAPVVAAIFGALLGAPTLRLRGDYLAIVTLGFGEIVRITLNNMDWLTRGPNGIAAIPDPAIGSWNMSKGITIGGISLLGNAMYYYLSLILIAVVLTIVYRVNDSRIGRAWVAVREDEVAAAAMGINTTSIKLLAFASGAFFAGMAGAVNAHFSTQVSPDSYTFLYSVLILSMVVLGGIGNPPGVVLGAVLLIFLPEKLRQFSDIRFLVFGFVLVLIMRFRPEGLIPSSRRRRELHAGGDEAAAESQQLFDVQAGS